MSFGNFPLSDTHSPLTTHYSPYSPHCPSSFVISESIITVQKPVLFLCLFFLCRATLFAQQPIYAADTAQPLHNLRAATRVMVDSLHQVTETGVLSGKTDELFSPYQTTVVTAKAMKDYWLLVWLKTTGAFAARRLMLKDSLSDGLSSKNDYADVYLLDSGNKLLQHLRTGVMVPRSQKLKDVAAGFNGVAFSVPAGAYKIYIRVQNLSPGKAAFSYPAIYAPSLLTGSRNTGDAFPVLNAVALLFSVLSFFFFFFIREKAYLFFGLYTLLLSQHYTILHPDVPFIDRFIPEHPQLVAGFWTLFTTGGFLFFCLFGRYFMNLPQLSKKTDRLYGLFLALAAAGLLLCVGWQMISPTAAAPVDWLNYFVGLTVLPFFIRFAFFKNILARLFIGGALWLLLFTVLGFLWNGGLSLPFNPWPVGQVGQLLIYAAALAYKVRLNEKARAEAARIKDMDDIKSKFFANISHEFRTPLTLIQGPLQQIEETAAQKTEAVTVPLRHLKTMRRNTDRLLELVNQLLDLSKLESGAMKLRVVKGDVLQLLKVLTASFESMAERKGIHYRVHFPEGTALLFFDKDKLEKIASNLLTNAFKYTPEGGAVSAEVAVEEGRLRLSVEDNGPGIPKKELDKIFDRFYQAEGTEDKGSGIGLALVKELVGLYRGQISVSSEPGKGSRFKISLPVEKEAFKEAELVYGEWKTEAAFINHSGEEGGEAAEESGRTNRPLLLIVEDNGDLRRFIKETVQPHYNVAEAVNGKEGLEKAVSDIPDLIVSDVMMPGMDGFALTEKLKKDERTSHIPVILLTAKAGQAHKLEGLQRGADDYLTKPFDAKELMARLQNLLNGRKLLRKKFAGEILLKPSEVSAASTDEIFLNKVMTAVEQNMSEEEFGVEELARAVAMSRSQLHRKLAALTGRSPSEVLRTTRLLRAKELLQKKAGTPSEVAYKVGFNSHTYFSKCFKEEFGMSPGEVKG